MEGRGLHVCVWVGVDLPLPASVPPIQSTQHALRAQHQQPPTSAEKISRQSQPPRSKIRRELSQKSTSTKTSRDRWQNQPRTDRQTDTHTYIRACCPFIKTYLTTSSSFPRLPPPPQVNFRILPLFNLANQDVDTRQHYLTPERLPRGQQPRGCSSCSCSATIAKCRAAPWTTYVTTSKMATAKETLSVIATPSLDAVQLVEQQYFMQSRFLTRKSNRFFRMIRFF